MNNLIKIEDVNIEARTEYVAKRAYSQLQSNKQYINNRLRGSVQVDGEKIKWYRCTRRNHETIQNEQTLK